MKNLFKFVSRFRFIIPVLFLFPFIAWAAGPCDALTGLGKVICQIGELLKAVVPVLVALGLAYFIWGVIRYVIGGDEEAKTKGRDTMVFGVIGLTVIVGIWGIVEILINTFDLGGATAPQLQPIVTSSACSGITSSSTFQDVLCYLTSIINDSIVPLLFAIAFVMFIWGTVKFFLINGGEEEKRSEGKQFMIWGVIAFAVMLSVWGLVGILRATFGINNTSILPQVTPPSSSTTTGGGGGGTGGGNICNSCSLDPSDPDYCGNYPGCSGN